MYSFFVFVALTLAGQVGNGGRYDQTPATTGPNNRTGAAGTNITPLTNSQPANNNANTRSGPTGAATSGNPYPTSPPPGFGPRSNSTSSNNGSPALGGTQSPSATTYPQQPGFPNDDAAATGQTGPSPTAMMQAMLAAPPGNQLRGEQVRLIEVISTGGSRNEQTQRVEAYWDLCSSVADYYLGLREQEELRKIGSSSTQPGESLQEAVQKFNVRLATSLRAAKASQYRLASLMTRGPNNLPLPGDLPHCGTYLTKYQEIFAGRGSPEAQELASLLAARYAELKDSASDVLVAQDWVSGVQSRSPSSDSPGSIRAMELLALRRRAFVQIARDYNRRIARYSELAAPGQIGPDRLTGILIKRPTSSTRSAIPTKQSSDFDSAPPQTFVNGSVRRDDAVRPTSGQATTPTGERSLLLVPLH